MSRLSLDMTGNIAESQNRNYENSCPHIFDLPDNSRAFLDKRDQFKRTNTFADCNSDCDTITHSGAGGDQGGAVARCEDGKDR